MNNKNPTRHVFKYKHTKWSRWCITASLNYKNTMINRITMETVACLRIKCHLKQNLIPSWPWSFRHTSCISNFRCKTKYTNKFFFRTPWTAYLAVLPVLVIFCPLGPTNFKKSVIIIISWFIYFYIHSWEFIIYIVFFGLINKSLSKPWKVEPDWIKFVFQIPTRVMVFNATFSNISLILWLSVLLVEETRVPGVNHQPAASHWQILSHNVVSSTPCHEQD